MAIGSTNISGGGSSGPIVLESRTDDPVEPEVGQIWIRTDLSE